MSVELLAWRAQMAGAHHKHLRVLVRYLDPLLGPLHGLLSEPNFRRP